MCYSISDLARRTLDDLRGVLPRGLTLMQLHALDALRAAGSSGLTTEQMILRREVEDWDTKEHPALTELVRCGLAVPGEPDPYTGAPAWQWRKEPNPFAPNL
jgi:hypothetical protein